MTLPCSLTGDDPTTCQQNNVSSSLDNIHKMFVHVNLPALFRATLNEECLYSWSQIHKTVTFWKNPTLYYNLVLHSCDMTHTCSFVFCLYKISSDMQGFCCSAQRCMLCTLWMCVHSARGKLTVRYWGRYLHKMCWEQWNVVHFAWNMFRK